MSAALDLILADTAAPLEVTAEIDSAKRSDGTLKTWYFSTHPRSTGAAESPANTEFLPFIQADGTLGPLSQSLSEDLMFNGLAENNPGTLTLLQRIVDSDQLSTFNDYVFAGYKARIKVGRVSDSYAAFEIYRTITIDIDPAVEAMQEGAQATFQLASALKRLKEETLIVKRYVGIPHALRLLTSTGKVTVTKQAGHDQSVFSLGIRFRIGSIPAAEKQVWTKMLTTSNNHWYIQILPTSGIIRVLASSAGAANITYSSSVSVCDGKWHSIIFVRHTSIVAFVILDGGTETLFTPTGAVDTTNTNLIFHNASTGEDIDLCDARYLNRYMTPDEARAYFAIRSEGDDLSCIGLWRFDDNSGATVNDYSSLNADGAIAGVLNTDYSWIASDLGEPELAGSPYPLTVGNVINAKAHLIDGTRERYRGNVDATGWHTLTSDTNLAVKSQGTVLTGGGTDYTAPSDGGDGVFSMTAQEAEPVTYDLLNTGTSEESVYPSNVVYNLLTQRTRFTSSDISNKDPLSLLCPWPSGYHTDQETTAQQAIQEILGESGMCCYEDSLGALYMDMLLPPTGYGPYGEPCLDLLGRHLGGIDFGNIGSISGSGTFAFWLKVNLLDQTTYNFSGTDMVLLKKGANYNIAFQASGTNVGKILFEIASTSLRTNVGAIQPFVWYFLGCVFDDTANVMRIYLAPKGSSLVEVASVSNALSNVTNSNSLVTGGSGYSWFSSQHIQVWSVAKSLAELQALMTTPPVGMESNLLVYSPVNDKTGSPLEKVSGTTGTLTGSGLLPQWAPKLEINLDETPSIQLSDFHHTHPASDIIVKYLKNRFRMNPSDIDSGVSQNNRIALMSPGRDTRFESSTIRTRFKHSKRVVLDSPITDQESALRLLRILMSRLGTDKYVGTLEFPARMDVSRVACGLELGNEVGVVAEFPSQLQTARSFRVAGGAPDILKRSTSVVIFG